MLACCGQANAREKKPSGGPSYACLLPISHLTKHLSWGWEWQIKEGAEGMMEAIFPILVFPKSGGSHPKGHGRNR